MKPVSLMALLLAAVPMALVADEIPPVAATPAAVDEIVYARPFTLQKGYEFAWRKEKPLVTEGMILVLRVKPDLVYPRACAEPVLFVGEQTAERVNVGYESGLVVCIVPGKIDLKTALIWFGTPQLPESVDAATIKKERELADKAGIKAFDAAKVKTATDKGGKQLEARDQDQLRRSLASLVREYAPKEKDLLKALETIPEPAPTPPPPPAPAK
jgi:hypothetical protein